MADAVKVDARELERVVLRMETNARNVDRLLPSIADALVAAVGDVYDAEGPNWEPFAASTIRTRGDMGAAKLLQDTGVMAGSTMGETGSDWAEARANVPYAQYHVNGTKTIPVRNPFDLGPFENDVLEEVAAMLLDEVAA